MKQSVNSVSAREISKVSVYLWNSFIELFSSTEKHHRRQLNRYVGVYSAKCVVCVCLYVCVCVRVYVYMRVCETVVVGV